MSGSTTIVSVGYPPPSGPTTSTATTSSVFGTSSVPASPATPIQHRLMLKTHAIDTWSLREQLGLASAVLRSGDQNWVSVSRQMKPFAEEGRPNDWFSQKNCALQYKILLEKVPETPRRKRGAGTDKEYGNRAVTDASAEVPETPGEAIVKRLTNERIQELDGILEQERTEIEKVQKEVDMLDSDNEELTEEQLDELEAQCEEEDRIEAERMAAHEVWLKDREEKKQAIQAALKAHSAKVPLKGAAALAVQQSGARRASSQSQGESSGTSDVDSPAPVSTQLVASETNHPSKSPKPESSSPLLTSLLQSPSSLQTGVTSGDIPLIPSNSAVKLASDVHPSPIVVIDSPKQFTQHSTVMDASIESPHKHHGIGQRDLKAAIKQHIGESEIQKEQSPLAGQIEDVRDGGDGEREATLHEHAINLNATGDKDSEMEDESDMKKPTGRSHDEHCDRTILPPTRLSRRKKLSEVLTAETGLVASDGCGNEDQELASTQNTPSSSASSSRASSRETRTSSKGGIISGATKKHEDGTTEVTDLFEDKGNMIVPIVPHPDTRRTSRKGGSSRTASRSSSPVGSVGIPDEDETDESENMDLGRRRSDRRRSDRHAQISKSEDFDSAPASPTDTASNVSESNKDSKIETDSEIEDTNTECSWRKQAFLFISEFIKHTPSKKSDKIFNPDTSAVIYSKENNKPTPHIRFTYHDLIKQPLSLEKVRKRIDSGQIGNNVELKRDFLLMLLNATVFNMNSESEVATNAKSIYEDFIAYLENHPIANSDKGNRYSSSKRSSSSGASKTSKTRVCDGTYSASSTKHPKTTEKDAADGDHNRSRKRTSSSMEETHSHQKTSTNSSNPSKKRRRIP